MALFAVDIPPGVVRGLVDSMSTGRYRDSNLIRWINGVLQPWRGWRLRIEDAVDGIPRAIITWKSNAAAPLAAIGTNTGVWTLNAANQLSDITPAGYTTGYADTTVSVGYGSGLYGAGAYGTPRPLTNTPIPAGTVSLDTWGENLIICGTSDGTIYEWTLDPMVLPVAVSGAPTDCRSAIVTDERILMAVGANGVPNQLKWTDVEDNTDWTESTTNQARTQILQTAGHLMRGARAKGALLIFSTVEVFVGIYEGPPYVYTFERGAEGCGLISMGAAVSADGRVFWLSPGGFWYYDGAVAPLPCTVQDYIFLNLNTSQLAKITCSHKAEVGEVVWYYPSQSATECDSYVAFQYRENCWHIGRLARTCGVDEGAFPNPMSCSPDGYIYEDEVGLSFDGAVEHAETGPIQIGSGDQVMLVKGLMPDDRTAGDVTATFYVKDRPDSPDSTYGPYTLTEKTDLRFTARKARMRFTGARRTDWRVGKPELDIQAGGRR